MCASIVCFCVGKTPGSGFTLSRVLKKRGSKGDTASTSLQQDTTPLTPSREAMELSDAVAVSAECEVVSSDTTGQESLEHSITTL